MWYSRSEKELWPVQPAIGALLSQSTRLTKAYLLVVSAVVVEKGQVSGRKEVAMRTYNSLKKDTDTAISVMTHPGCCLKKAG